LASISLCDTPGQIKEGGAMNHRQKSTPSSVNFTKILSGLARFGVFLTILFVMGSLINKSYASDMEPKEIEELWTQYLERAVTEKHHQSAVDYAELKKAESNQESQLQDVLDAMSAVRVENFENWSKAAQIAFLVNAYNAFTIRLILDFYPVKSIIRIRPVRWPGGPWKYFRFELLEREMTLDKIEHEILRKKYDEPRIHFAINCASRACPPLLKEAFSGEKLEEQLEAATKDFLSDRQFHFVENHKRLPSTLRVSAIFDWFMEDFGEEEGLRVFLAERSESLELEEKRLENPNQMEIKFNDYNWCLNDTKGFNGQHGPNPGTVFLNCDKD
jgi:hypothetical protein